MCVLTLLFSLGGRSAAVSEAVAEGVVMEAEEWDIPYVGRVVSLKPWMVL